LATNLHITEPDGGIDARCVNTPHIVGRLIPRSMVDYQFKGGTSQKSVSNIVDEDVVKKPRVMQGLQDGHAFVYVTAWDRSDATDDALALLNLHGAALILPAAALQHLPDHLFAKGKCLVVITNCNLIICDNRPNTWRGPSRLFNIDHCSRLPN